MLGSEKSGLLKLLLKCRKYFDIFSTVPYQWDKRSRQFVLKSTKHLKHIQLKCYISISYFMFFILQFILFPSKISLPLLVQCIFYTMFYGVGTYVLSYQLKNSKALVALLNEMLVFESKQNTVGAFKNHRVIYDFKRRLGTYLIPTLIVTATLLPILGQVTFFRKPCNPTYPGFFLLGECRLDSKLLPESSVLRQITVPIPSQAIKIVLIIYAVFSRLWMCHALHCDLAVYLILKPFCLNEYIRAANTYINEQHTVLGKLHDVIPRGCMLYRQIQLLLKSYNQINRRNIFTVAIVYLVVMGIASLYVFVNWGKYLPLGKLIINGYTGVTLLCMYISMLGILADINQSSVEFIKNLTILNSKLYCKRKYGKRWIRSLAPVKIYLGYSNFVESCTPIVMLNFVVGRTVDLSIMT